MIVIHSELISGDLSDDSSNNHFDLKGIFQDHLAL